MSQVDKDFYAWNTMDDKLVANFYKTGGPLGSRASQTTPRTFARCGSSSGGSSCSDDRSNPLLDFVGDPEESSPSPDEAEANSVAFAHDDSYARRKLSTCSETSSINSACPSLDGGCTESERNSSYGNIDFDAVPVGANRYDDIIGKIVELTFSQKNLTVKVEETSSLTSNMNEKTERSETTNDPSNGNEEKSKGRSTRVAENIKIDDVNGNYQVAKNTETLYEDDQPDDGGDDDLTERGPVRPHFNGQTHHGKSYCPFYWLNADGQNASSQNVSSQNASSQNASSQNDQNQSYTTDYEHEVRVILGNKQFSEKLNPCLDKLSVYANFDRSCVNGCDQLGNDGCNAVGCWPSPQINYAETGTSNSNIAGDDISGAQIPLIVVSEPGEASLLQILANNGFQAAQSLYDVAGLQNPSPTRPSMENSPDSPASSHYLSSSQSRSPGSSPATSPSSSSDAGSPPSRANPMGSPPDSCSNLRTFRGREPLSSSESSSHSYGDTPSPTNYHSCIDQKTAEQLDLDFDHFSTWCRNCPSSGTIVDSAETIDAIDSNELQLVEEVIRCDQKKKRGSGLSNDTRVAPKSYPLDDVYETRIGCLGGTCKNGPAASNFAKTNDKYKEGLTNGHVFENAVNKSLEPKIESRSNSIVSNCRNDPLIRVRDKRADGTDMLLNTEGNNHLVCPDLNDVYDLTYADDAQSSNLYNVDVLNPPVNYLMDFENSMENLLSSVCINSDTTVNDQSSMGDSSKSIDDPINPEAVRVDGSFNDETKKANGGTPDLAFNEFQIPETVSSYRRNRIRRISGCWIAPWPSLNLPLTASSERLKAELDPVEVEKAMKNLLKKPTEELAASDEDGDTPLMCLVGNPSELEKKKAYLVPLVERLRNITGALAMTNNRGEDALYLAAMNSPKLSCVTGYLAAAMIQKGIDISQRFYHARGDTLIHAIAAKGDTHVAVLAELLSLRTTGGSPVFDLSKRNYDGRTPLHVAVESHGPLNSGVRCIGITRLLLENGADIKIKETKCGNTALHIAVSLSADPAIIKVLLHKSDHDDVNITNYNNNTPVHMAAALSDAVPIERQMKICTDLIRAGGQTNMQNRQGKSPLALVSADRKETIKRIFHKKS